MTQHEKLLSRIQKLLNLSNSPNEAEATAAAEKAQALLAEHRLTMHDLPSDAEGSLDVNQLNTSTSGTSPWIRVVWSGVAKLNFCDYVFTKQGRRTFHHIIGDEASALATQHMAEYLIKTIRKLGNNARKENREDGRYQEAFIRAAGFRVRDRLHTRTQELRRGQDSQNNIANAQNLPAVYASNDKALSEFMDKAFPNIRKVSSNYNQGDAQGARDGRAAGDNIGLEAQIAKRPSATLAIGAQ